MADLIQQEDVYLRVDKSWRFVGVDLVLVVVEKGTWLELKILRVVMVVEMTLIQASANLSVVVRQHSVGFSFPSVVLVVFLIDEVDKVN